MSATTTRTVVSLGIQGFTGPPPVSTITASFVQPAANASVSVTVGNTTWMIQGAHVYITGAGTFTVDATPVQPTHSVSLTNTGATGNAAPGDTIASGSLVAVSGPPGPSGPAGPTAKSPVRIAATTAATSFSTAILATGAIGLRAIVAIGTAYSAGATLTLGQAGSPSSILAATDTDLTANSGTVYDIAITAVSLSALPVMATIGGSPSVGAATITLIWDVPTT